MQTTEKEAQRASIVVHLLYEFTELCHASHERAQELADLYKDQ